MNQEHLIKGMGERWKVQDLVNSKKKSLSS